MIEARRECFLKNMLMPWHPDLSTIEIKVNKDTVAVYVHNQVRFTCISIIFISKSYSKGN